jgi:hypothetical protein
VDDAPDQPAQRRPGVEKLWETCGQIAHARSTGRFVSAMMSFWKSFRGQ